MIETTYGQARTAYAALGALTRMNLQIPLSAALRWKRIAGVLKPIEDQAAELEKEIGDRYMERGPDGKPKADEFGRVRVDPKLRQEWNKAIDAVSAEPVTVGADLVKVSDLGSDMSAPIGSQIVGLLEALGPFLLEDTPAS